MLRPPLLEFHTLVGELVYDVASFELACRRLFWLGALATAICWGRDDVPLSL